MSRQDIDQVAALIEFLAQRGLPSSRTLPLAEGRNNFRALVEPLAQRAPVIEVDSFQARTEFSIVPIRLYRGATSLAPLVVYFHGGGWVFGDLDTGDPLCRAICVGSGATVASVDYRRAPEHPYPAAFYDCVGVTTWLRAHAQELAVDPARICLVGDSSGGNLAAATSLWLRDRGELDGVRGQVLLYPALDPRMNTASFAEFVDDPFLSHEEMRWYWSQYLLSGQGAADGYSAPALAPALGGLPPAVIVTAGRDPLRDEGRLYARGLRSAGVAARVLEYQDMPHGFLLFTAYLDTARRALHHLAREITASLGRPPRSHLHRPV